MTLYHLAGAALLLAGFAGMMVTMARSIGWRPAVECLLLSLGTSALVCVSVLLLTGGKA